MNEMQIFERAEFGQIRTTTIDDEPWFVAKDICNVLGLDQVTRAVDRLDADEVTIVKVTHPQSPGKLIDVNAVNEPGMYSLILRSNKPEAKAFKRWITHEVLPAIRKTGAYATNARLLEAAQLLASCKQPSAIPALVSVLSEYTGVVIESPPPGSTWCERRFEILVHVRNWIENNALEADDFLSEPRDVLYHDFLDWVSFHKLNVRISMKSFCAIVRNIYGFAATPRQTANGKRYFCK